MAAETKIQFAFRELFINQQLIEAAKEIGWHDGTTLKIGELEINDSEIRYLAQIHGAIHVGWEDPDSGPIVASLIVDDDGFKIVAAINYGLSRRKYTEQLTEATSEGLGGFCRDTECRFCGSKILTVEESPWSPQVYCLYCDSLNTTIDVPMLGEFEKEYRLCPECLMYSRPRTFTIGYFYFLIVHAGVHHDTTHCCPGCMRPKAWKMVFGNLFGLLGMPLAITQLIRVYRDSIKKGPFQGLDKANRLLRRGKVEKALEHYWIIVEGHPVNAGILYNVAMGLLARGDLEHAEQTLNLALENCSNYSPARRLLAEQFGIIPPLPTPR